MTFNKNIELLSEQYPSIAPVAQACAKIRETVASYPFKPFFEPVAVIDFTHRKRKLLNIDPAYLLAWTRYITYSTRLRITHLEDAIALLLLEKECLSALVLLRSHLESSGMAALCLNTLSNCMSNGDTELLNDLIPKTLFGTSLLRAAKKDPDIEDLLSFSQGDTVTVRELIDALVVFAKSTGGKGTFFQRVYSLLCEFAHPNFGGTAEFREILNENDTGRWIQYSASQGRVKESVEMALETLLLSMKVGHASCSMLCLTDFVVEGDHVCYSSPSKLQLKNIWDTIIHVDSTFEDY